jgi:hypothetical protein
VAVCVSMLACSETSAGRIIAWDRLTVSRHNMGRLIFCLLWVVQRLSSVGGTRPTMSTIRSDVFRPSLMSSARDSESERKPPIRKLQSSSPQFGLAAAQDQAVAGERSTSRRNTAAVVPRGQDHHLVFRIEMAW